MNSERNFPAGCEHDAGGSGITRRQTLDALAAGGLWAAFSALSGGYPSPAQAAEDAIVHIGYLPITDATAAACRACQGLLQGRGA